MVQPGGEPTKTDALERRAERLLEEYAQALKMKKVKDKIDDLEFELYVKKAERNQLSLEIFTNRKLDIYV
jgi:molybdenum-dependent DNA-binding transcriptional regulator ModE